MAVQAVYSQTGNCNTTGCPATTINISTGFDQATATLRNPLVLETNWTLTGVPTSSGITLPAPAWVIAPNAAWANFPNARWVSPFQSNSYNINNNLPTDSPFTFDRCFCVCQPSNVTIQFELLADDIATVFLDGVQITTPPSGPHFWFANRTIYNQTVPLTAGQHCLRVSLRNTGAVAMGFALQGQITGANLLSPVCCNPTGSICGTKLRDVNCDGNVNPGTDPGLSGWTIQLRDSLGVVIATTVTNTQGNYCFSNLPAGTYQVTEVNQPGWTQTFPSGTGTHTINLTAGSTATALFGNCQPPTTGRICESKLNDLDCNGSISMGTDPALSGWTIQLRDALGNVIATTVTDAQGNYCFNNLPPATYQVSEVNQPGWTQTFPSGSGIHTINLTAGSNVTALFGNCQIIVPEPCDFRLEMDVKIENCEATFFPKIGTLPSGYQIVSTEWTFGDGYSSNQLNPTHFYSATGVYKVCFKVTIFNGKECCTREICKEIKIEKPCDGECEIKAEIKYKVDPRNCEVTFFTDILYTGLPITSWFWEFGDGSTGSGSNPTHQYAGPGVYNVCVTLFAGDKDKCCFKRFCTEVRVDCERPGGQLLIAPQGKGETNTTGKGKSTVKLSDKNVIILDQNVPNPFAESTVISYNITANFSKAQINFVNANGKIIKTHDIVEKGQGQLTVFANDLSSGVYTYTLVVDGKIIDSKRMIKE